MTSASHIISCSVNEPRVILCVLTSFQVVFCVFIQLLSMCSYGDEYMTRVTYSGVARFVYVTMVVSNIQ